MGKLKMCLALGLMTLMLLACSLSVMAEVSPEATTSTEKPKKETSAKTGESNVLVYSLAGACALAAIAVYAGKKLRA